MKLSNFLTDFERLFQSGGRTPTGTYIIMRVLYLQGTHFYPTGKRIWGLGRMPPFLGHVFDEAVNLRECACH